MKLIDYITDRNVDEAISKLVNSQLNPKLWTNGKNPKLIKKVRDTLLKVAKDFSDSIELEGVEVKDIYFTGSNANYNWNKNSDMDLHLLVDVSKVKAPEQLITDYFHDMCLLWNDHHDIRIYGYKIEIYIQLLNETLQATGIYSLLNDKWVRTPKIVDEPDTDEANVIAARYRVKVQNIKKLFDSKKYDRVLTAIFNLRGELRKMRKDSLNKGGEYSPGNIAFKMLRNDGSLESLSNLSHLSYDNSRSLVEIRNAAIEVINELRQF